MSFRRSTSLLFLLLGLLSTKTGAQTVISESDTLSVEADARLQRVERMLLLGPHRKNPNAAGRMRILRAKNQRVEPLSSREQLVGPAYKNRRATVNLSDTLVVPTIRRTPLTGPRYKNRGAKSRRQ